MILKKILLAFFSCFIALLIVEISLRIIGVSYPQFHIYDQQRGLRLNPNTKGWVNKEGKAYIKINSKGLRDREHSVKKPPGTLRIAVLGDSFTEGMQVPMEQDFCKILESELNKCKTFLPKKIEVINFGVSTYGTAQEYLTLKNHVWNYSPDIVILAIFTGNDIIDNSYTLSRNQNLEYARPYFVYNNNQLLLDTSFLKSDIYLRRTSWLYKLNYNLINHSHILQIINKFRFDITKSIKLKNKKQNINNENDKNKTDNSNIGDEGSIDNNIYLEPINPDWEHAWKVTENLLVLMKDEVRKKGANFLVVTLSNGIQVYPDSAIRKKFMERLKIKDLFYPDLRIKRLGIKQNFEVLNLSQYFQHYADTHKVFLHGFDNTILGFGHWNAEGHKLGGIMMAKKICNMKYLAN